MASRRWSRRGSVRALLAGMAASALAFAGAVSAAAEDIEPSTTITGTVTRADDGTPVSSVSVFVNNTDFTKNGTASTDANGAYTVSGLEPGTYTVRFATEVTGTGLISEYWDGARTREAAQRIVTVGGETIPDINATLGQGATIAGRVTRESDGAPLSGVSVSLAPSAFGITSASVTTDADGVYRAEGLEPASYIVKFSASDPLLADEYWDGAYDEQSATLVSAVAGQPSLGIDASLAPGGIISGQVTAAADGAAVVGSVAASGGGRLYSAQIGLDGSYSLSVAPGSYMLQFVSYEARVLSEYWENARTEAEATSVTVAAGQPLTMNAQLEAGRAISGVVLADGQPLVDAIVESFVGGEPTGRMAYTDQNGEYEMILPPGDYTVRAHGTAYDPVYAWQYFDGVDTASEATAVSLGSSSDRTGVDFALSHGGVISGAVSGGDSDLPATGAEVTAYLWSAGAWREVTTESTVGGFALGGTSQVLADNGGLLPEGTYTIGVEAEGFCTQFLGGASTPDDADSIELASGEVLGDIDLTLTTECPVPEPKPTLALAAGSIRAGNDIAISGTGFAPGATIAFELHSDPIALGTLTADADGALQGTLRIPATAPAGAHTLVALSGTTVIARTALTVTAAAGTGTGGQAGGSAAAPGTGLASTGLDAPVAVVAIGVILSVMGGMLVRRRRVES